MATSNGYGSVRTSTAGNGSADSGDEAQPLLGQPRSRRSWRKKATELVHRDWTDVVLLLCYFITGLLDSASISTWGSFVSMQTGNTVYIGLGLAAPHESSRWIKSGVSLIAFCIGSFIFSRFHRLFTPSRRWVLCVSFIFQMILIVIAASILTWGPSSPTKSTSVLTSTSTSSTTIGNLGKEDTPWQVLVPIALIAFQSCGQAVTSRALKYNTLTSVVLTSIYCDLFSDAELFVGLTRNAERNRRAAAPLLLLLGAVAGGLLAESELGAPGVLWIAAGLKAAVVLCWGFWRAAEEEEE